MVRVLYPFTGTFQDYPDDESYAVLVYFCGCEHNCKLCYNKDLQNYENQESILLKGIEELYSYLAEACYSNKTNHVVFSGGDPLATKNIEFVKQFLNRYQDEFNICLYTGHDIEFVKENNITGFEFIKCGKMQEDLQQKGSKQDEFFILASSNQNFYDSEYNQISTNGVLNFN